MVGISRKTISGNGTETEIHRTELRCISPLQTLKLQPSTTMPSSHNRPRFTRGHSCAPCYQRKVKCDGQRPCSTCVKHSRQTDCHTAHPAVVRLTAAGHEAIMSRLRHCENLLAANGISVDDQGPTGQVESPLSLRGTTEDEDGHVIIHRGHLRFVDK